MKKNLISKHFLFSLFFWGIFAIIFLPPFSFADLVDTSVEVLALNAPTNLTATVISGSQIDLSWSSVSGAVSYKVYRDSTYIASSTTTSYSDTGLSSGVSYSYTVSAVNAYGGESDQSSSVSATTLGGGGMSAAWYNPPQPPAEGFKVLINNGAEYTNSLTVTLNLTGGPDTERMAISNFPDFHEAGQEPYKEGKEWNLCKGLTSCPEGEYTVYAKFYAPWGKSSEVVSDNIVFRKKKPIIEKIKEVPKKIGEEIKEISKKTSELTKKVAELIKPKKPILPKIPVIPEHIPLVFQGKWQLLPYKKIYEFVLAPLPREFQILTSKFPTLKRLFTEVEISKLPQLEKLKGVKLTLPGLTERVGLKVPKGIPVAKLSPELKEKIPTDIVFAKTGGERIDFNIALEITKTGRPEQRIRTISGKPLSLAIKPDQPVEKVKGYIVFKKKSVRSEVPIARFSLASLIDSLFFANPVLAVPYEKPVEVEERLVLIEFEYTDPDGDGIYTAQIQAPKVEGEYEIITVMDYEDPSLGMKEIRLTTVVDPEGYIFEKYHGKELRIARAKVTLYWQNPDTGEYELWPAEEFLQKNPQITDSTGKYSFLVPSGEYYIKVEAPGYLPYQSEIIKTEEGSGIHTNIELRGKYWWLRVLDWRIVVFVLTLIIIALIYKIHHDKIRRK